ncbi:MAG TPA: hypothetical protein VGX94_07130 [Terriglobia bacterium]|nr:hypothetical protein [Terriglobia bacterium]
MDKIVKTGETPAGHASPAGLCGACCHVRVVRSDRGSVFYQCRRSLTDPTYPAYPRIPVLQCEGYERRRPEH